MPKRHLISIKHEMHHSLFEWRLNKCFVTYLTYFKQAWRWYSSSDIVTWYTLEVIQVYVDKLCWRIVYWQLTIVITRFLERNKIARLIFAFSSNRSHHFVNLNDHETNKNYNKITHRIADLYNSTPDCANNVERSQLTIDRFYSVIARSNLTDLCVAINQSSDWSVYYGYRLLSNVINCNTNAVSMA